MNKPIASMQAYAEYKDSGVDWLGEIPVGWDVKRLKYFARIKTGYTPSKNDTTNFSESGIIWAKPDNLNEFTPIINSTEKISTQGIKKQNIIPQGSVLVCCIGSIGKFGIAGVDLVTNQQINALVFKHCINVSFGKFLVSASSMEHLKLANGNVVKILNTTDQGKIPFPLPPLPEQIEIAEFLDDKTAKIDRLLEIKRRQIALLGERKQILIQNAVTKGLNPDAPMKDSGVDWIGEIPAHWGVKRLTKEVLVQEGPGIMAVDFQSTGVPLIRISGVKGAFVSLKGCNYLNPMKVKRKWGHFKLHTKDLVISGSASTGLISEVDDEVAGSILYTGLIRMRPISDLLMRGFLKLYLGSKYFFSQIDDQKTGSTISHFGPSHLSNMNIFLPSRKEQIEIEEYVALESKKLDTAIAIKQSQITKLKEYKTTLINAAVTGKIKIAATTANKAM